MGLSSFNRLGPTVSGAAALNADRQFTMDLTPGAIGVSAPFPKLLAMAKQAGFESIAPNPGFLAGLSALALGELKESMKRDGLRFGAAGLPVEFRRDESTFQEGLSRLPSVAATLERAEVTRVGTWIMPNHPELTYRANFDRHAERLGAAAKVLADHGLRLGLEYVGPKTLWTASRYPFIHTMAETKDLIVAIDANNVGIVLDSFHWYTAEESIDDLHSLSNDQIVACDLNDAPSGVPVQEQVDGRRELPSATGVIDLKGFLEALVAIGYDGPIRAEPFNNTLRAMPDELAVVATADSLKRSFALLD